MGAKMGSCQCAEEGPFAEATGRAKERIGKLPVEGRYHRLPRRLTDDYYVQSKALGSGYSGTVFQAKHKRTGNRHAIKSFPLTDLSDAKKKELEDEIEIFLSLDHPHIVRLTEVYESEDEMTVVMECMEGGELYTRVAAKQTFTEKDAAQATYHMLLAVNYLHSEHVVHRDLKLENFMYDSPDGDSAPFLKLLDFGFGKFFRPETLMEESLGTISYVAPEVLAKNYSGGSCDMWSLGVIVFVLLGGYMPFSGRNDGAILRNIKAGNYYFREERFGKISVTAKDFIRKLLVVDPAKRLTADQALQHAWITTTRIASQHPADPCIAKSFLSFARASRFQRACMQMMAWSLTLEDRKQLRDQFLALDTSHTGVIKLTDLREWLQGQASLPADDLAEVLASMDDLDADHDGDLHYSDFLAAMMASRVKLHGEVIEEAFRRFDTEGQGYITQEGLQQVLGSVALASEVMQSIDRCDANHDGRITSDEFVAYVTRGDASGDVECAAHTIIDRGVEKSGARHPRLLGRLGMSSRVSACFAGLKRNHA